jgi:intracellular multiplication protein IcmM
MSREKWNLIKLKKGFYVRTFHRTASILAFSVALNLILGLTVSRVYLGRAENKFYATNGAMPPEELTSMDRPNITSSPLLADDPVNDEALKIIPQ